MFLIMACMALVAAGAAIQVAVGAGLSIVCGAALFLWLGTAVGVPVLLLLNLLVSLVATALGGVRLRWGDVALSSGSILLGCAAAAVLPSIPEAALKGITAAVLLLAALPRPTAPVTVPGSDKGWAGIAGAGIVTGMLTLWTASPGPVTPVALARAGRSGDEVRRVMQPVSCVGYGVALAVAGLPTTSATGAGILWSLITACLAGAGCGFMLRPRIEPGRVVKLIRLIAVAAAALLLLSLRS
ncbi:Hypothetical protein HVPorG_03101 (plasmid) [Roseomonas mucosa]|uniref:hypothetical protein n=1 Tax=Roseomonas mucosa TaxID=207340 RepID=UPI00220B4662|nr:hypothetical protein [Roseomonas mucosa]QDJ11722.1 Hypothetical protein HVPorG_03101 [Roseomonas mucosa]